MIYSSRVLKMKPHLSDVMFAHWRQAARSLDCDDVIARTCKQAKHSLSLWLCMMQKHWDLNKLSYENTSLGFLWLNSISEIMGFLSRH